MTSCLLSHENMTPPTVCHSCDVAIERERASRVVAASGGVLNVCKNIPRPKGESLHLEEGVGR